MLGTVPGLTSCGPRSLEAVLPCLVARRAGMAVRNASFSGVEGARVPVHDVEGAIKWLAVKLWVVLLLQTSSETWP